MCSDAANGEYEGFKVTNEIGCSGEEATTSESRLHLSDILEMLVRLDHQGIFMNPVNDSIAPDYSAVIKNPICFLTMREKIYTEQYTSWFSFVEEFECMCYNAMKYNKKRSQIWNAANLMLRQGKRCLEQQFSKHSIILGLNKMLQGHNHQEKNAAEVKLVPVDAHVLACKNPGEEIHVTADKNPVPENSSVSEVNVKERTVANFSTTKSSSEDEIIEIEGPLPEEDSRLMFDDQATECSSSFSGTQSELEDENCAVDSQIRDGNGANAASTENLAVASRKKKRVLDGDWKTCKQDIEWRCRWLELHIQSLQAESNKYKKIIEAAETRKGLRQQDNSVARTSYMDVNTLNCRILRRRRRQRAEECLNSMLHMSSHPIFGIHEKQKQHSHEMSSKEESVRQESQQNLEFDDFGFDLEIDYEDNTTLEKDTIEQYLWQIESLQMQISSLKNQLVRSPTILENATRLSSEFEAQQSTDLAFSTQVPSPIGMGGRFIIRELKSQGGTPSRRRNSDFDINNVIMPDSLMANYVEPARHAFIETPHWRLIAESAAQDEQESSEEDTDDEAYEVRHAFMQARERQPFNTLALNKSRHLSTTKERPKSDSMRRRSLANASQVEELQLAIPIDFGSIPKRKRRKRESRGAAERKNLHLL